MPAVLRKAGETRQRIATTMAYYVDLDADDMADDRWTSHPATAGGNLPSGNNHGNTPPESPIGLVEADALTYNEETTSAN